MIGVRGGTFDPIHLAHLRATQEVADDLGLDEVRLIPGHIPPHRPQPLASSEQRLAMLELAIDNHPRWVADDREIQRESASYTVDTLLSLRHELGESLPICLILGMDAFQGFTTWHQWESILTLSHLVVTSRPDYTAQPLQAWAMKRVTAEPFSLKAHAAGKLYFMDTTALAVSATQIRHLQQAGRSIRYLVPDKVNEYIQQHQLYRTA